MIWLSFFYLDIKIKQLIRINFMLLKLTKINFLIEIIFLAFNDQTVYYYLMFCRNGWRDLLSHGTINRFPFHILKILCLYDTDNVDKWLFFRMAGYFNQMFRLFCVITGYLYNHCSFWWSKLEFWTHGPADVIIFL